MLLASFFILGWIVFKRKQLKISPQNIKVLAVAGIVIAVHWLTFFGAIKASNVSITLALMSTGAFFTSILEPIFYKRKLIWYELVFGTIVIIGLYIIFKVETEYLLGIGLALCSAFLSAIFTLINGKMVSKADSAVISFYELGFGVVGISLYLLIMTFVAEGSGFTADFFVLSSMDWVYIGVLASVCTAYAFIASVMVMRHLSPYTIMLTINLEPVYGIILAYFIFGNKEKMSTEFYLGAVVIVSTVILNGILKNRKKLQQSAH
ncbi:DMT family transporter [Gangjinia marincola]|uniref:DMT family transporter n=2 Tax=Gangjinia marincola TaxID=578463 RepID=A0ABN1MFU5_9FLAO